MKSEKQDPFLQELANKAREEFLQEIEDFVSGKRKEYPYPLAEPLYVDPKKWGPEPDGGKVHEPLTKAQRQYRQEIADEMQLRWKWLHLIHGIDPDQSSSAPPWEELCEKLAFRHVPGLRTTNTPPTPPKPKKRRGAPRTRGLNFYIELVAAVSEAGARVAKKQSKANVPTSTALQNLDRKFLEKWNLLSKRETDRETLLRSLATRHSEAMKWSRRARRMGLPTLEDLGKPPYKNSETD
jgi:hypothetical protein